MMAAAPDLACDASALKLHFPGLADPQLHYLDNAATAQMPEVVLGALRRFEIEARVNVHEGIHRRAKAATEAYQGARQRVAGFLGASSEREVIFTYGATFAINLLAHDVPRRLRFIASAWVSASTRSSWRCLTSDSLCYRRVNLKAEE